MREGLGNKKRVSSNSVERSHDDEWHFLSMWPLFPWCAGQQLMEFSVKVIRGEKKTASSSKGNTHPESISVCHFYRDEQSNDLIYCTVYNQTFSHLL